MKTFVYPYVAQVDYRGIRENQPINVALVLTFSKAKYNYYPDNEGKPAINFKYLGDKDCFHTWVFNTELERETELLRLRTLLELL